MIEVRVPAKVYDAALEEINAYRKTHSVGRALKKIPQGKVASSKACPIANALKIEVGSNDREIGSVCRRIVKAVDARDPAPMNWNVHPRVRVVRGLR